MYIFLPTGSEFTHASCLELWTAGGDEAFKKDYYGKNVIFFVSRNRGESTDGLYELAVYYYSLLLGYLDTPSSPVVRIPTQFSFSRRLASLTIVVPWNPGSAWTRCVPGLHHLRQSQPLWIRERFATMRLV